MPTFSKLLSSDLSTRGALQRIQQKTFESPSRGLTNGLGSTAECKANDILIEIPLESALSTPENGPDSEPIEELATALVQEWVKGDTSRYFPYIQNLPDVGAVGTPLHWSDDAIGQIPYLPLIVSVAAQRKRWDTAFDNFTKKYASMNVSRERFLWAMEIVASRAFRGIVGLNGRAATRNAAASIALLFVSLASYKVLHNEDAAFALGAVAVALTVAPQFFPSSTAASTVLLPIVDSCNHDGQSPTAALSLEPAKNCFVVRANTLIPRDEQVTISYGDRHNDDLIQYFGFVERNNPFDRYVIMSPLAALEALCAEENSENATQLRTRIAAVKSYFGFKDSPLVVNRGPIQGWKLGGLQELQEQASQRVSAFDPAEEDGQVDALLKQALMELMQAESNRLKTWQDGHSPQRGNLLNSVFIEEKLAVLTSALSQLQRGTR